MAAYPAPPRNTLPQQIGRYQVLERIGRGAMGLVYRARDEAMGRDVALKLLAADLEDEPEIRARFLREAEAAARLSHPNIITIFDVGEDRDRFFIVMELLRGATLKDFLEAPTTLERKIDLMIQLCAGLGAAHHVGVYHRDIKPGNLFVRTDGILKILDFGIARLASSNMTIAGFIVGTPDYMSPEQARGDAIDARSDIFSAGSVFYFMVSGRKPFAAADLPTVFRQVEFEDPPPLDLEEAPTDLARVIMKAMSKDKALRHQSCQELMAELVEVRNEYTTPPRASGGWRAARPAVELDDALTIGSQAGPPAAVRVESTCADDTVEYQPFPVVDSEETATLPPLARGNGFADRVGSFFSGVIGRLRRARAPKARGPHHRKG